MHLEPPSTTTSPHRMGTAQARMFGNRAPDDFSRFAPRSSSPFRKPCPSRLALEKKRRMEQHPTGPQRIERHFGT